MKVLPLTTIVLAMSARTAQTQRTEAPRHSTLRFQERLGVKQATILPNGNSVELQKSQVPTYIDITTLFHPSDAIKAAGLGQVEVLRTIYKLDPALLSQSYDDLWTPATIAASNGQVDALRTLHELNPTLLSQTSNGGWTPATRAAFHGQNDALRILYDLDPKLLSQTDASGWTPATIAPAGDHVATVLRTLHELNPTLLSAYDNRGRTLATSAASYGQVDVLRTLYDLDPTLIFQPDGRGVTPISQAISDGRIKARHTQSFKVLHTLSLLLSQSNGDGYTPATLAAAQDKVHVLRILHQLNPALLSQMDNRGVTPAITAVFAGRLNALHILYELNPTLSSRFMEQWGQSAVKFGLDKQVELHLGLTMALAAGSVLLGLVICKTIFDRLHELVGGLLRLHPRPTTISPHAQNRDANTFKVYRTLRTHLRGVNLDAHLVSGFLPDIGLKMIRRTDSQQDVLNLAQAGRLLYLLIKAPKTETCIVFVECLIKHDASPYRDGICALVEELPNFWEPRTDITKALQITADTVQYGDRTYPRSDCSLKIQTDPQSGSLISQEFAKSAKFRWALGYASNAALSSQMYKPIYFYKIEYPGADLSGCHAILAVHYFCKENPDPNEVMLREAALIGGINNGVETLVSDRTGLYRLCEKGQLQYLLTAVIQGRLPGVWIDDTNQSGFSGIVPKAHELINECCRNANALEKFEYKNQFLEFVNTVYIPENPFLADGKFPELKTAFMEGIETAVTYMSDPDPVTDIIESKPRISNQWPNAMDESYAGA